MVNLASKEGKMLKQRLAAALYMKEGRAEIEFEEMSPRMRNIWLRRQVSRRRNIIQDLITGSIIAISIIECIRIS